MQLRLVNRIWNTGSGVRASLVLLVLAASVARCLSWQDHAGGPSPEPARPATATKRSQFTPVMVRTRATSLHQTDGWSDGLQAGAAYVSQCGQQ